MGNGVPSLSPERISDFSARFRGDVIHPKSATYDAARSVWNGMIDRRPACIARCKSVEDVQNAIRFARDENLPIAIRGGGHNAAGLAVVDDGMVIDLSDMRDVVVDPARRTARAGGGVTWGEFDAATAAHGLATTGGAVSTTGIAGLTLGGGLGWLMRSYGMTCDNLIGADVVTADGELVRASASENPDLLWALRGGGGNFGVVTTFEFQLHPVLNVFGGILLYPFESVRDVMRLYRDVTKNAPDALTMFAGMLHSPDGAKLSALVICYNGSAADGEKAIKPIRDFAIAPVAGEVGSIPYTQMQKLLDDGMPKGLNVHWRSEFVSSIPDELIEASVSAFAQAQSPLNVILIEQFGGAANRVAADATAFDQRDASYNLVIISRWTDPADAETNVSWARATSDAAKPFTNGRVYVNYIGAGEASDRVRSAYSPEKFARLASIKRKYDPMNVFRINQNIPPAK
jgi:FAD/FMN-containing dehydrogenase